MENYLCILFSFSFLSSLPFLHTNISANIISIIFCDSSVYRFTLKSMQCNVEFVLSFHFYDEKWITDNALVLHLRHRARDVLQLDSRQRSLSSQRTIYGLEMRFPAFIFGVFFIYR